MVSSTARLLSGPGRPRGRKPNRIATIESKGPLAPGRAPPVTSKGRRGLDPASLRCGNMRSVRPIASGAERPPDCGLRSEIATDAASSNGPAPSLERGIRSSQAAENGWRIQDNPQPATAADKMVRGARGVAARLQRHFAAEQHVGQARLRSLSILALRTGLIFCAMPEDWFRLEMS